MTKRYGYLWKDAPVVDIGTPLEGQWARATMTPWTRFLSYIDKGAGSCWLWTGALNANGYGQFCCRGKGYVAHRLMYEAVKGEIPVGLILCHQCDVRRCVSPEHLVPGTRAENSQDASRKGRLRHVRPHHDIVGRRFGALVAVCREVGVPRARWLCRCDCGAERRITPLALVQGRVKSCGCTKAESTARRKTTHGKSRTAEYGIWVSMIARCYNPHRNVYHMYGGRGITVCDEWRGSFEAFMENMGPRPSLDHSVERRDGDAEYGPGNCYWATSREQARNRKNTLLITMNGRAQSVAEWARELGLSYWTIVNRMKHGKTAENCLSAAPLKRNTLTARDPVTGRWGAK